MIVNTCRSVLEWCAKVCGFGLIVEAKGTASNPRNLPTFRFNVDSAQSLNWLIPQIRPHLKIKTAQADAVLKFIQGRESRRGTAFTPEEIAAVFDAKIANQKSYNKGTFEHIRFKGKTYDRQAFGELINETRDGSIYRTISWTSEMDSQVGTASDLAVAQRLGLKLAQVQRRRTQLGIPPFGLGREHLRADERAHLGTSVSSTEMKMKTLRGFIRSERIRRDLHVQTPPGRGR